MRFGEVYFSLATLDVFEPDFVFQVDATNARWRYLLLSKPPVKQLRPLRQ
jgi:hypothetical protein